LPSYWMAKQTVYVRDSFCFAIFLALAPVYL
jgi:hypothetical protein